MSEMHAESVGWTRDTMLPPAPPPGRQSGAVGWLRENLFSGPLNIALTLAGFAAIYAIVAGMWPWLSQSVWRANSLSECRSIITATFGEGETGACWAMLRERWSQFIFGFYPRALVWRPILAFGVLFVALAPILFADSIRVRRIVIALAALFTVWAMNAMAAPVLPLALAASGFMAAWLISERRAGPLLAVTALYPALAYWLLWGGSIWGPVLVLAVFGAAAMAFRALAPASRITGVLALVAIVFVGLMWVVPALTPAVHAALPVGLTPVASEAFGGFLLSITIGVSGIAMSLPLGIVLALGRQSNLPLVKMFSVMFIEFIRGVPLITLLFVASLLLNYFLPPGTNFDIILRVIIMVTLFAAAYMAEVIRGGLAALPKGQYEAADALGLDYWKAQRLIILPQALKISIPGIVSTFIGMFKDTTLVTFVGLFDPLKATADTVRASIEWKGTYWEPYIFTGAIFFILCFGMSRYSMHLERRLKRDHR